MIKILLETDGKKVFDSQDFDEPTLAECSLIVFRMELIKKELLSRDFKSEFEVESI